jgi:serine/threonine protein kinase
VVVDVLVKYPLMGCPDEWKDTFQTCAEEVEMYRQIETWKCPFLLRYYGTHGPGVVFEFVDGEALDTLLDETDATAIQKQDWLWSELGLHTCTALKYLQERAISHNDLKPANIRYSASKKLWKVLDLGLATNLDMKVCKGIGTDGYRAPEVAATGRLHATSDVFGLGVVMEDALEALKTRYKALGRAARMYDDVLAQAEAEEEGEVNSEGEIDLETERVLILQDLCRSRSFSVSVEEAETLMEGCMLWQKLRSTLEEVVAAALEDSPDERPSVKRLLHVFRALMKEEEKVRETQQRLFKLNVY